jgi:hypothetical protein
MASTPASPSSRGVGAAAARREAGLWWAQGANQAPSSEVKHAALLNAPPSAATGHHPGRL